MFKSRLNMWDKSFSLLTEKDLEKIKKHFIYEIMYPDFEITEDLWEKIKVIKNNKTEYYRLYRQTDGWKKARDKYRKSNKGKLVQRKLNQTYTQKEEIKELRKSGGEWRKKLNKWRNAWDKKNFKENPELRVVARLRTRVYTVLKDEGLVKEKEVFDICGCSRNELISHIESKFKEGMSWDNLSEWHLDHIVPVKYFRDNYNFDDITTQKICFHYSNMQPLWEKDNLTKATNVDSDFAEQKISEIRRLIK